MLDLFLVICSSRGKKVAKQRFNDYESALNYATNSLKNGVDIALILQLDYSTMKWHKKITLYPYECC